jgi:hypothetical protein
MVKAPGDAFNPLLMHAAADVPPRHILSGALAPAAARTG